MSYTENKRLWNERLAAFHESGISQVQRCKANGVSVSALKYWLKKSSMEAGCKAEAQSIQFASLIVPKEAVQEQGITLEVGLVKIHLSSDFNEAFLQKVIRTLQQL